MDGGEGLDWICDLRIESTWEDALGVEGFDLASNDLDAVPPIDSDNRISLHVELEGQTEIAGQAVDIFGAVEVTESGVDLHVAYSMNSWSDAFGIEQLSLNIRPKGAAVRKPMATPWVTASSRFSDGSVRFAKTVPMPKDCCQAAPHPRKPGVGRSKQSHAKENGVPRGKNKGQRRPFLGAFGSLIEYDGPRTFGRDSGHSLARKPASRMHPTTPRPFPFSSHPFGSFPRELLCFVPPLSLPPR